MAEHVVLFSGGKGSWATAQRVIAEHGATRVRYLFTDTLIEDVDTYRFIRESAAMEDVELVWLTEGRTPFQVFVDKGFMGNTRQDPCSYYLKRRITKRWREANYPDPTAVIFYLGIDWTESHRIDRAREWWAPYRLEAPLCDPPWMTPDAIFAAMRARGIDPPHLYSIGLAHNNCGGFCVKGGQGHYKQLLEADPERYMEFERKELETYAAIGKTHPFLRKVVDGKTNYLTLREFREMGAETTRDEQTEIGGCACF